MNISSNGNYIYVKGYTFPIIDTLKEYKFSFNYDKKIWYRFGYDPDTYYKLASIINNKPNTNRSIPPDHQRCTALCNNGFRCKLKRTKGHTCKIHHLKDKHNLTFL